MDINESLQPIVAGIIDNLKGTIEAELRDQISNEVVAKIANTEFDTVVQRLVEQQIQARVNTFNFAKTSDEELQKILAQITSNINRTLVDNANQQISAYISQKLAAVDLTAVVNSLVTSKIGNLLQTQKFPEQSIHHSSINFAGVKLTGDAIKGGIIENFGSVGIEDRATHVQLTLLDHASAFEGPVWAPEIKVKGDITLDGRLVINGEVATDCNGFIKLVEHTSQAVRTLLNDELFSGFSDIVFDKIRTEGLDLDKITQSGRDIVKGGQLGYHITDTNIRRLGVVDNLVTAGEATLCDTIYTVKGRVGINTKEPNSALSIWDQEVEVTVNKHSQDTAFIGTPRRHNLVIGANNNDSIKINVDGVVHIDQLVIGSVPMTSAPTIPNYPGIKGQIVWNANPNHGSAIGWVCLGSTLWAKFGTVE